MKVVAINRMEFIPPRTGGWFPSFTLAVLAHLALVAVLRMGVEWKHEPPAVTTVEAELWSNIPQQAAPPAPTLPIETVIPPQPAPLTPPTPTPQRVAEPVIPAPPPPKALPDPAIALAKEKARKEKEKLAREREAKEEAAREAAEQKAAKEKERKLAERKEKEKKEKNAAALDKFIQEKTKAASDTADKEKKQRDAANAKLASESREKYLKDMMNGTGDARSTNTAATQSSGPSASYAGRIRARIKPNITYTETISGNPVAEVLVHIAADGTILNRRLTKSSGVKSWDNAVLNAIDKTEVLPTDVDGRVQPEMVISFRPKD